MSFGFSIGDAVLLTSFAWKVIQNSRKACGEHDELTREVTSLHLVLRRLEQHVSDPESLINRNASYVDDLQIIVGGCHKVLKTLDLILRKYNALNDDEKSGRKLWQKVRFGNGEMADMANIKTKLIYYTSNISLFLNMISMGSIGRVESKMNAAGGELREIRQAVNGITAHLMTRSKEESILTSYEDDERTIWKEFRRELIHEGFSSSVIQTHKELIKAYVRELGERGVLDETCSETEEPLEKVKVSDERQFHSETSEMDDAAHKKTFPNQMETSNLQTSKEKRFQPFIENFEGRSDDDDDTDSKMFSNPMETSDLQISKKKPFQPPFSSDDDHSTESNLFPNQMETSNLQTSKEKRFQPFIENLESRSDDDDETDSRMFSNQMESNDLQTRGGELFQPIPSSDDDDDTDSQGYSRTRMIWPKDEDGFFEKCLSLCCGTSCTGSWNYQTMASCRTPYYFREYRMCEKRVEEFRIELYTISSWRQNLQHQVSFPTNAFVVVSRLDEYVGRVLDLLARFECLISPIIQEAFKLLNGSISPTDRFEHAYFAYHDRSSQNRSDETARFKDQLQEIFYDISTIIPATSFDGCGRLLAEGENSWKNVSLNTYLESYSLSVLNRVMRDLDSIDDDTKHFSIPARLKNDFVRSVDRVMRELVLGYPEDRVSTDSPLETRIGNAPKISWKKGLYGPEQCGFRLWFLFHKVVVNLRAIRKWLRKRRGKGWLMKPVEMIEEFSKTGDQLLDKFKTILKYFDIRELHSPDCSSDKDIGSCACSFESCIRLLHMLSHELLPEWKSSDVLKILNCIEFANLYILHFDANCSEILRQAKIQLQYWNWEARVLSISSRSGSWSGSSGGGSGRSSNNDFSHLTTNDIEDWIERSGSWSSSSDSSSDSSAGCKSNDEFSHLTTNDIEDWMETSELLCGPNLWQQWPTSEFSYSPNLW